MGELKTTVQIGAILQNRLSIAVSISRSAIMTSVMVCQGPTISRHIDLHWGYPSSSAYVIGQTNGNTEEETKESQKAALRPQ
jgi:hypothetical protein